MRKILFLNFMLAVGYLSFGQMTAHEAVEAMGRGINLGNTLDATNYEGGWGTEAREYYFDMYKEAGFKSVRIPVTWNLRFGTEAPYTIDEDFALRLDTILDWCLSRDLIAIINVHHDGWIKNTEIFDEQKPRFYALWEQLADRYKDYPEHLFFEIINEPHSDAGSITVEQLNELNSATLEIMRVDNPTRMVLYGGTGWSSSNDLFSVAIPDADDDYLMAYYHSYDPWNFAGEGQGTWGSAANIKEMTDQMDRVQEWSEENDIPVVIGEFGAVNYCDFNSRMLYYANYVEHAIARNLVPVVWDDDGDFQMLQRVDTSWNVLKDIMIYSSDSSIVNFKTTVIDDSIVKLEWESRLSTDPVAVIERKTLETEFEPIGTAGQALGTSFIDSTGEVGFDYIYRIVEQLDSVSIPSYPQSAYIIPYEREPFHGVAFSIPGVIEAEDYDIGGQLLTYYDTEKENIPGAYRPDEAVDIEIRPDSINFQVGYVEQGEWIEYTIDVAEAGDYTMTGYFATPQTDCKIGFEIDGDDIGEIDVPVTGSWTDLETANCKLTLEAGEQFLRINILSENAFNIDKFEITKGYNGVAEISQALSIYPNPAINQLFIDLEENQTIEKVEVLDLNGRLIQSQSIGENKAVVNTSSLNKGLYILNVTTLNMVITKKFVVK